MESPLPVLRRKSRRGSSRPLPPPKTRLRWRCLPALNRKVDYIARSSLISRRLLRRLHEPLARSSVPNRSAPAWLCCVAMRGRGLFFSLRMWDDGFHMGALKVGWQTARAAVRGGVSRLILRRGWRREQSHLHTFSAPVSYRSDT